MMVERLLADDTVALKGLVTTVSTVYDRISIHGVRRSILRKQAESLALPLFEVQLGAQSSNDDYEHAFHTGLLAVQHTFPDVRTMAFGDLFLEDVRNYREALLARVGWTGRYPLWHEPTPQLATYFVQRGYEAILTCVDTQQLDATFAGRTYDTALLEALPDSVDPCGERGEFHTCVVAGPIFRQRIAVTTGEQILRENRFQYCDLLDD